MDYEQKLTGMLKDAMKAGDKARLMALRSLKSVILNERTSGAGELTDERAIQAIASYRKKMAGAAEQYSEMKREDLAENARKEVAVCDELLPPQLTEEELHQIADRILTELGAADKSAMGRVMGAMMKEVQGRADGGVVKRIVLEKLA